MKKHNIDELINKAAEETPFAQKTEMGEMMDNLDDDQKLNKNTRLKTREINSILAVEELIQQGILPDITLTTKFKELKISEGGEGRKEKVKIGVAEREAAKGGGFMNLFKRQE